MSDHIIVVIWVIRSSFVYLFSDSCHLLLISSVSVRVFSISVLYCAHFAWNTPLVSLVLLKRSLVFPILLFFSVSFHYSLRKAFLPILAILWNTAFRWACLYFSALPFDSLLFAAICKPPQIIVLPFCISFSWGWFWSLPPVQCYEPPFIGLQALCLSDLISWIFWYGLTYGGYRDPLIFKLASLLL